MKIYADTSFMVSLLYPPDVNHGPARAYFKAREKEQWIVSPWLELETLNSLRQLCLRTPGPTPVQVEAARRVFKHYFVAGPFRRQAVNWDEAITDCHQISVSFATHHKCRAAEILHIAILEQLDPDEFVSGDRDQIDLGIARGFHAVQF